MSEITRLYTKEELAIHLHVSVATINKWITDKKLHPIKVGKRCLFDLTAILQNANQDTVVA